MKALAYAFSAENPHALRNILLVAVTIAYLVVIVVLFLRLRHANQKMADRMKELSKQKQAEQMIMLLLCVSGYIMKTE